MTGNDITDQNNDNMVDEHQDILEEHVDNDNNNEVVHISCLIMVECQIFKSKNVESKYCPFSTALLIKHLYK